MSSTADQPSLTPPQSPHPAPVPPQSANTIAVGGSPRPVVAVGGKSGFNPVLDGIRGTAILLVMLYHMTVMDQVTRFDTIYKSAMGLGWVGVDLFFVLSGFLITGILWDSKYAPGDGSVARPGTYFGNFYARRTLRIFPLYYAVVFVCLVIIPHVLPMILQQISDPTRADLLMSKINRFGNISGFGHWFWLYLSNVPMAMQATYLHGVLGVSWSLAIEEQFYLVWPAVVYVCSRTRLLHVCIAIFAAALVWRLGAEFWYGANHVAVYVATPSRMDALVAGAFLAMLVRHPNGFDLQSFARRCRPVGLIAGLAALLIAIVEVFTSRKYNPEMGVGIGHTPFAVTVGLTLLGIFFASMLMMSLAASKGSLLNRIFTCAPLRLLGKYAYALYLFHQPIRAVVRDLIFGPMPTSMVKFPILAGSQILGQLLYYPICIGLTLLAAMISWKLFENPILKFKHYFPSGAEQAAQRVRLQPVRTDSER